jgi:hypothetical protein
MQNGNTGCLEVTKSNKDGASPLSYMTVKLRTLSMLLLATAFEKLESTNILPTPTTSFKFPSDYVQIQA